MAEFSTSEHELVLVIDFGGQYNQLIARRVREHNIYCEVISYKTPIEQIKAKNPKGIIFTGGPRSVYLDDSPRMTKEIFELGIPIFGICYGTSRPGKGRQRRCTGAESCAAAPHPPRAGP